MLKKKTRKAIRKTFKKQINKHGPRVARHLATGLTAAIATYLGAEGKKGGKKLKNVAKNIPGGKKIVRAITSAVPALGNQHHSDSNGHRRRVGRAKKSTT